ncbi:MAG: T9SS type A sorting domain-containing protein [Candidatus Kapabacteria bacterium]|nr:T9SS type A sorting domain-containing protein [Candidatus Kapabacteria bacterium]
MSKKLLILAMTLLISFSSLLAEDDGEAVLRRSAWGPGVSVPDAHYPQPFSSNNNHWSRSAASSGYYVVDNFDEVAGDFWRPRPVPVPFIENGDPAGGTDNWRRIFNGPNAWSLNPGAQDNGNFFRNPGDANDTTDDAFAGPIPIFKNGRVFYFNGVPYDSFYVSTNGVIALSNNRYTYTDNTTKTTRLAYNPMSEDRTGFVGSGRDFVNYTLPSTGDPNPDNWGFQSIACGGAPATALAGIRARTGFFPYTNNAPIIAPFWGDLHLSQWNEALVQREDFGRVFYRRSGTNISNDSLTIYFENIAPIRTKNTPLGAYNALPNLRPGQQNFTSANAQVILTNTDNSVNFIYMNFQGVVIISNRSTPANQVFRLNSLIGVSGRAFRNASSTSGAGWNNGTGHTRILQSTTYNNNGGLFTSGDPNTALVNSHALKFKAWKNTMRLHSLEYRARRRDASAPLDFYNATCCDIITVANINNYELLAGDERLGNIQPVALVQNLQNNFARNNGNGTLTDINVANGNQTDIGAELIFQARYRVINEAILPPQSDRVYIRTVPVDSACLDNNCLADFRTDWMGYSVPTPNVSTAARLPLNNNPNLGGAPDGSGTPWYRTVQNPVPAGRFGGIPPYGFTRIAFPPFVTSEFIDNQIGRLRMVVMVEPIRPDGTPIVDQWPFDDTLQVQLFNIRRIHPDSMVEFASDFHVINGVNMPSVHRWVNIDCEVTNGNATTFNPLPPRGIFFAENDSSQSVTVVSPVIRMNRLNLDGSDKSPIPGFPGPADRGDELRSFPIDMRQVPGKQTIGSILIVSYQRTGLNGGSKDFPRGWNDQTLIGPEPRSVVNNNPQDVFVGGGSTPTPSDNLILEFARPTNNGLNYGTPATPAVTNIGAANWRSFPRRGGAAAETSNPAWTIFGSGGFIRGFGSDSYGPGSDKDTVLSALQGLRVRLFDDGHEDEFLKIFLPIPDTIINWPGGGGRDFRFRLRVSARNHQLADIFIPDDADDFFVDNIYIQRPFEVPDLEITSVKARWPYTIAPASQATQIPIDVKVSNISGVPASSFSVWAQVFFQNSQQYVYLRNTPVPFLPAGNELVVSMPNWDASQGGPLPGTTRQLYDLLAAIEYPGRDVRDINNIQLGDFEINFGDAFAYDPVTPRNDVPSFDRNVPQRTSKGLNTLGYSQGGIWAGVAHNYLNAWAMGDEAGSGAGQLAARFQLFAQDTIKGFQAYFAALNQSPDVIEFGIYPDQGGIPGSPVVPGTKLAAARGYDPITDQTTFDEYTDYKLATPVILQPGIYWVGVAQLGQTGLELGGSASRMGMRTTNVSRTPNFDAAATAYGAGGYHLLIDRRFRRRNNNGDLINDNYFAYENNKGSNTWTQMTPTIGNPGYGHLGHYGASPVDGRTNTLSRGSWIPMVRPFLGMKSWQRIVIPVELTYFEGNKRNSGVDLFWETAQEVNNAGFEIQRIQVGKDTEWKKIEFVRGVGNSQVANQYGYFDQNVVAGNTYQYRLKQIDIDGSSSESSYSNVLTFDFNQTGTMAVDQNFPNPFNKSTNISFELPFKTATTVEIVDLFGNVVKTLVNSDLEAGRHNYEWDGSTSNGTKVTAGTYIYRVTTTEGTQFGKMTFVQ